MRPLPEHPEKRAKQGMWKGGGSPDTDELVAVAAGRLSERTHPVSVLAPRLSFQTDRPSGQNDIDQLEQFVSRVEIGHRGSVRLAQVQVAKGALDVLTQCVFDIQRAFNPVCELKQSRFVHDPVLIF